MYAQHKPATADRPQPAVTFNNTIAFPLILLNSLGTTGILDHLLWNGEDSATAINRAKSYFLVNSMVSDTLTFGIGPKLLGVDEIMNIVHRNVYDDGMHSAVQGEENPVDGDGDVDPVRNAQRSMYDGEEAAILENERTTLLPNKVAKVTTMIGHRSSRHGTKFWERLPTWLQIPGDYVLAFISAPLVAAVMGVTIGLVPALQTAFFAEPDQGGYLHVLVD